MTDKRFKVGLVNGVGVAAIWIGAGDTLPFTDPDGHADRVLFTTKWPYSNIIDKRSFNVTFPQANGGGERSGTINLFAHGQAGMPRVRGNFTVSGEKISMGCHVPIQHYTGGGGGASNIPSLMRLVVLGATSTNVVICWYANLLALFSGGFIPSITIPVTIEVFNELN